MMVFDKMRDEQSQLTRGRTCDVFFPFLMISLSHSQPSSSHGHCRKSAWGGCMSLTWTALVAVP